MNQDMRGQRHILQSLDYVLYCFIVYIYFLDGSFLLLVLRMFLQLQLLSSSSQFHRSFHASLFICCFVYLMVLIYHLLSQPGQPGIIIDFIGHLTAPTKTQLCLLDTLLLALQVLRACILYQITEAILQPSSQNSDSSMMMIRIPPVLASALGQRAPFGLMIPQQRTHVPSDETGASNDGLFYQNDVVLDISVSDVLSMLKRRQGSSALDDETMILPI
ncbi:hypothetical protein DM01DRAFT_1334305 [Hesseltinella vesiculosa]|uniref:DUF1746 domain-containing protein n=1 Tax=Hesseltinella vesiculosa TaxID=101127 RepID=A0A1X2GLU3_9FUNG|nr:hypothetical protein DM01DRAFT_1334305 [Hesseltinella vesiculosa]